MTKIYYESDFKIIERLHKDELKDIPFRYTYFADHAYSASWDGEAYENCKRNPDGRIIVVFNAQSLGLGPLRVKREYFIPDSDFEDGIRHEVDVEDTGIVLVSGTGQPVTVEMEVIPPYIYIQEIVDNTTDTSPVKALSANQGRLLRERIETVSEAVNRGLRDEATQRMAADTALGNRIANNKTSLNALGAKLDTNLANLRAKDAELEEAIRNEAQRRQSEDDDIRESIGTVSERVATAEAKIAGLQGNVTTLQKEVENVRGEVVPKAVAEGIAQVIADAPEDLNTLKEVADYIASDKTKASQIETAISDLKVATQVNYGEIQQVKHDAESTLSMVLENSKAIQQHSKDIEKNAQDVTSNTQAIGLLAETLETKAPKVGYAPDLKVDFAKELVGRGVAAPQEIGTIRPTGVISIGDGNATIERVKGKSVVWNQIALNRVSNSAYTYVNGGITILNAETSDFNQNTYKIASFVKSHKYLIIKKSDAPLQIYNYYGVGLILSSTKTYGFFGPYNYDWIFTLGFVNAELGTYKAEIRIYDLTQMFGAGNEPTTIEEFEARRPLGVSDEYNEGEIISYDAKELKSVGFNAFNGNYAKVIGGEEYHATGTTSISFAKELEGATTAITLNSENKFIPEEDGYVYAEGTDIVIHLTHSYTPPHVNEYEEDILQLPNIKTIKDKDGNQLFPYGLLSAGSVHDEITATKAVKRVGRYVIDGSQKWTTYNQKFRLQNPNIDCKRASYSLLASRYKVLDGPPDAGWANFPDKSILIYNSDVKMFVAWDSTYRTVEDFQASLVDSPIIVNYELATPIEVDLPEPLNLTYDAWDFGTEELVAEGKTTPLNADIVYQFNAVDRIRENTTNVSEIEEEVATKQQELTLTVLDNGNIRIGNLQGQTKDFMPATPSGDPMHYAYEALGAVYNSGADVIARTPWDSLVDDADYNAKWGLNLIPDNATFVKTLKYKGVDREVWQMKHPNKDLQIWVVAEYASDGTKIWDDTLVVKRSGMWYMNGLGDLTNADMRNIVMDGRNAPLTHSGAANKGRTNQTPNNIANMPLPENYYYHNTEIEIYKGGYICNVKNKGVFVDSKVRHIIFINSSGCYIFERDIVSTKISTANFSTQNSITYASTVISARSIIFLLNKTTATVTITFPSALYDRLMDTSTTLGAELVALLETKSNITFARGE